VLALKVFFRPKRHEALIGWSAGRLQEDSLGSFGHSILLAVCPTTISTTCTVLTLSILRLGSHCPPLLASLLCFLEMPLESPSGLPSPVRSCLSSLETCFFRSLTRRLAPNWS
jgi:hypothetical protein